MIIRTPISKSDRKAIQNYIAATSVGPSTVQSYPGGTLQTTRQFLGRVKLEALRDKSPDLFPDYLSYLSSRLKARLAALPTASSDVDYFGISRKVVNIFLHNAYYNRFFSDHFELDRFEDQFEVPIDSRTAKEIRNRSVELADNFPHEIPLRWKAIKSLTPTTHATYQIAAAAIAKRKGTKRVHLDAHFWPPVA